MSNSFIRIFAATAAVAVGMAVWTPTTDVSAAGCLDQTGCVDCCPTCGYRCVLDAECVDEEIDGFKVESEVICIPRVVFPWQRRDACGCMRRDCSKCLHNGARLRRVCVLKGDSKTCPRCKYEWEAKKNECYAPATPADMPSIDPLVDSSTVVETPSNNGVLSEAPYEDFSQPYPFGFEEATTFPQPLENDGLPDSGFAPPIIPSPTDAGR